MEENNKPDEALTPEAPAVPVDVDVAPPDPVPDEPPKPKGPSIVERFGARTLGLAAACLVLFVVVVLLALMIFAPGIAPVRLGSTKAGYAAQRDLGIAKVATRFAKNFLTFDYRTIDANLADLNKDATGNFASQLRRVRGEKELMDTLRAQKATSRGTVRGQTVESIHGDTASIRIFLAQTITNKSNTKPQTSYKDVLLTLVKTSKGWKVDNVG